MPVHQLSNGLKLVCDPLPGVRTFALTAAVRGGARWEPLDNSGWSHFLEHLVFKGAGDMSARDIVERIEGQGGSINAATGYERTAFEVRSVAGTLPLAVQVLGDLLFRPTLLPEEIEREKDVVAQEIAEAFDTHDDHIFEMAQAQAFEGQALGRPILGSNASLKPVDAPQMEAWRQHLYDPARMVVVASGAVQEDTLLQAVETHFGQAVSVRRPEPEVARFVGGYAHLTRRIEQAHLVLELPSVGVRDPGFPAVRLMAEILGGGMASRLFQKAREALGLAYAIDAWHEGYEDIGRIGIYAGCAAEKADELADLCARELMAMAGAGPSAAELDRAKAVLAASLWMADESLASRASRQAAQVLTFGQVLATEDRVDGLLAVTRDQVRQAAVHALRNGVCATATLGPKQARGAGQAFRDGLFGQT